MDHYLRFVNCVQALRRRTEALTIAMGGALGVAADPLPHQLASARRVLSDTDVRHLLSDEVGLGKTVQALMIVNALRWQYPKHRTMIIAPDNLLAQWQEECWIRGHVMPALAGVASDEDAEKTSVLLARPRDLVRRQGEAERTVELDGSKFDLLVVDEPQTMPREIVQTISQAADSFRQVLVLSATPRLGDAVWRDLIMRMVEPVAAFRARFEDRAIGEVLADREVQAHSEEQADTSGKYLQFAATRRVIRNGRDGWGAYLPVRRNREVTIKQLAAERERHEIAAELLGNIDRSADMQGRPWTSVRALQRSARAARDVLTEIAGQGGALGQKAERARAASLEDPGDSRLEALLDLLSEEWQKNATRALIIVCGDNPTIDMLRTALPRYFPDLADRIGILRRPATAEIEAVTNLREVQETLAPFLDGSARLLLVGDWVQAGLNLHHAASRIVFYSMPWEMESIDQLIGRVDRLGSASRRERRQRQVRIWRLVHEGAQEAAIADVASRLGVFEAPLPPLSDDERKGMYEVLSQAAISGAAPAGLTKINPESTGLATSLQDLDPFTSQNAIADFESWQKLPVVQPAMLKRKEQGQIENSQGAMRSWLETITRSGDFEVGSKPDKQDPDFWFGTLWYYRLNGRGRPVYIPFTLPGTRAENWMSDHQPYIIHRARIPAPPRKTVVTDSGEDTGRPLHFLDHGSLLHDALVEGYIAEGQKTFGKAQSVIHSTVTLPEGHPAKGQPPTMVTVADFDPFPDEMLPLLWSPAAKAILATASSDAQREGLAADRLSLHFMARAVQRWVRFKVPAQLCKLASSETAGKWADVAPERIDAILGPLVFGTNVQCAKGRTPVRPLLRSEIMSAVRRQQTDAMNARIRELDDKARAIIYPLADSFQSRFAFHWREESRNRELVLERRKSAPIDAGPRELRLGQIAALERSLEMSRLCEQESANILSNFMATKRSPELVRPLTIVVAFAEQV
ncbi:SNF2-related protein [Rhizobium ruizarguesonis]